MKKTIVAVSAIAIVFAALGAERAFALPLGDDLAETLSIVNVDVTASIQSPLIEFDMNGDGNNDFQVVIRIGEDLFGTQQETGFSVNEFAEITIVNQTPNNDTRIFVADFMDQGDDFHDGLFLPFERPTARLFSAGESVGAEATDERVFQALLYAEGEAVIDGVVTNFSVGPFSEVGDTGFVGIFVVDPDGNDNFGFAELTRGSITVGDVGFQTINGAPAPVPLGAVPVPPALGLLAGALALFGLLSRRRKLC